MSEQDEKQLEMARRFKNMVQVTKQEDKDKNQQNLAHQFMQMMDTTRKIDSDEHQKSLAQNFAAMIQQTRSFDSERERLEKAGETAISDAFAKMMHMTHRLEEENKKQFEIPTNVSIETFPGIGDKFFHQLISKLPKRIQRFPAALRRNPRAVIKYFLAMALGRILAITLYVVAAFIPALPVPESVAGVVGKAPTVFGSALTAMRGAVVEFSPQAIFTIVSNIPTDINKLIQKVGEFFQYYGQRAGKFLVRAVRHPKWAAKECWNFIHQQGPFLWRIFKGALGVAFSFFIIKLAMIFLLPLFGGIAITVLGFKISIILLVIVRMAISTGSEFIGKIIGGKFLKVAKDMYEHPEKIVKISRSLMDEWMRNWVKENKQSLGIQQWVKKNYTPLDRDEEKNKS